MVSLFFGVVAATAIVITVGILSVGSCALINSILPNVYRRKTCRSPKTNKRYHDETKEMQALRNNCIILPEQISEKGLIFVRFYAFLIFVSLFLIKLAEHFEKNDEIVSAATVCVDLITLFAIAMIFSFSAFIIQRVVGVKAKYAKLYYKNMLP